MKRRIIFLAIFLSVVHAGTAQQSYIDSLKLEIISVNTDTANLILFGKIADVYSEINPDSSYYYAEKMLVISKKLDLKLEETFALNQMGYALLNKGNYPRSLQTLLSSLSIAEDPGSEKRLLPGTYDPIDEFTDRRLTPRLQRLAKLSRTLQYAGILYVNAGNYEKAINYYKTSLPLSEQSNNLRLLSITYSTLGRSYLQLKQTDSALYYLQQAYDFAIKVDYNRYLGSILLNLGRVYMAMGKQQTAKEYYRKALMESTEHNYFRGIVASNLYLAEIYKLSGLSDSSLYCIKSGLPIAYYLNAPDLLLRSYTALADYFNMARNSDSTVKYQSLIIKINDSLFNKKKAQEFQNIDFDEQQRVQQIEAAKSAYRNKFQVYLLLAGIGISLLIAIILLRNNRHKQRAFALLSKQKQETDKQKNKAEQTLVELKSTQAQLIQSEKMASLGELTAGIAHEIQNPLNFVNNFSEINRELLMEMKEEIDNGNVNGVKNIAHDVIENEEKINFHGKRADAIVKGMLQHSRSSSGVKEPTDINRLTEEYLRLAYHGLRAKDKSFQATLKTDYDQQIGDINIIPQDIGRVILNLITNAFYAVTEKKKSFLSANASVTANGSYEPTVTVSTKKMGHKVEIRVGDNGNGIPQKVLNKIFQPFFTTKPTGQGTGLGLSLSYDIVKAHGGELKLETKEGEGSEFVISLPI